MSALSPRSRRRGRAVRTLTALAMAACLLPASHAQEPRSLPPDAADEEPTHSALDTPLFYQLLIGELELRGGASGNSGMRGLSLPPLGQRPRMNLDFGSWLCALAAIAVVWCWGC